MQDFPLLLVMKGSQVVLEFLGNSLQIVMLEKIAHALMTISLMGISKHT